jgi:proton-dependent oligopeptide transporter, POT family
MTMAATLSLNAAPDAARRGLLRLSLIELWERFSYYTLMTLLPLFLVAPVAKGGLAWAPADALVFYGATMAVVQILPFPCGLVAERWLGNRRALYLGAWLMMAGHLLLGGLHVATGNLAVPLLVTALGFVALGNGFFKPNISAMVGRLPHGSNAAADAAFGTFYVWINAGGAAAALVAGFTADRFGWALAFSLAAGGMAVALLLMRLFAATAIDPVAHAPRPPRASTAAEIAAAGPGWLPALLLVLLFALLFGVAYFQTAGTISLFTQSRVDREILGFTIPTGWFLALNPVIMILVMPPLARGWRDGHGPGHAWSSTMKMRAGFLILALAFAMLLGAVFDARTGLASPLWIIGCIVLLTTAELFVGPVALAAVSRITPPHRTVPAMGGFMAALGIGGLLSGQVGAIAVTVGELPIILAIIVAALASALALTGLRPWFEARGA